MVMAAALATFNRGIKVAYLKVGLRSDNLVLSSPEKGDRRLAGAVMSLHLAPTPGVRDSLLHEGIAPTATTVTDNAVIDTLHHATAAGQARVGLDAGLIRGLSGPGLKVLITVRRRES